MFGRRRRDAHIEAIEAALAADADARDALADALAHIDARLARGLEDQALTQASTGVTVQHLRATVADTRSDLAQAVAHLAQVCSMLSDRMDAEQAERRMLIATMAELARPSALERRRSNERVVGGSFDGSPPEALDLGLDPEPRPSRWS